MRRRAIVATISGMLAGMVLPGRGQAAPAVSALYATPHRGHSGDIIDLSGSGLPPHTKVNILMACPNWHEQNVYQNGNLTFLSGPTTDAHGEFSGFLFRAVPLRHVPAAPMGCEIYSSIPNLPIGPDVPAVYIIMPAGSRLARCERTMCVTVRAAPRRVRHGLAEHINLSGWPGARAEVGISYSTSRHVTRITHLDYKGRSSITESVPAESPRRRSVRVAVHTQLGPEQGNGYTDFTVMH